MVEGREKRERREERGKREERLAEVEVELKIEGKNGSSSQTNIPLCLVPVFVYTGVGIIHNK
jgi:hypothetical protein